jgi:hypothetical protein
MGASVVSGAEELMKKESSKDILDKRKKDICS